MLAAARVTLKQHRFELGAVVLAGIVVGVSALLVAYRLDALGVAPGCIVDYLGRARGPAGTGECFGPMSAWSSILSREGGPVGTAMSLLPFAAGLLAGVPIVARELETRTAQTAWSLNASRMRWLVRQIVPVVIVVGLAVAFAGMAASVLQAHRQSWGELAFFDIGRHGPPVVARAFGAFGVGLLVGALLGRTLPAFVVGALLSVAVATAVGVARDGWLRELEPVVIMDESATRADVIIRPRTLQTGWAWLRPDGSQMSNDDALALVPVDVAEHDDPVQPIASMQWLEERGYALVPLGVTDERALDWTQYDALAFGLVGLGSIGGAVVVVNRRRPL